MTVTALPAALTMARARRSGRLVVQRYDLWRAANQDEPRDQEARARLYRHALVEAAFEEGRRRRDGQPIDPCPVCGAELGPVTIRG